MSQRETAVIYARYSSTAQRDASIEQQIKVCQAFADRLDIDVVKIYEDRAMTGTNDHRPGFQQMIADAYKNDWAYVIVYALDRFARDRYDSAVNKKKLKEAGVRVQSATETISNDPTGIIMESLLEGMAEYYSAELSAKVRRGMKDNASKCKVNGPIPPGYCKGPDGKYQIVEVEAAAIKELFDRVRAGETIKSIVDDYAARGVCKRNGKPWTRKMMDTALNREVYTGVYLYGGYRVEGGVPQIVDRETYDAVQTLLSSKPNPRSQPGTPSRRRRKNGTYLLTGKLFCGHCKTPMVGVSGHSQSGAPYYYYACKQHLKSHSCDLAPIRRDLIEAAIAQSLVSNVLNDAMIPQLADACLRQRQETTEGLELQVKEANLKEISQKIANIMTAIEAGVFSPTVQARLQELEAEKQQISLQIESLKKQLAWMPSREDLILTLMMYREGDLADPEYLARILDTFLVRAYVYEDHFRLIFMIGDGKTSEVQLPYDLDPDDLDPDCECSYKHPQGRPLAPIRTSDMEAVTYSLFMLSCSFIGHKNHSQ